MGFLCLGSGKPAVSSSSATFCVQEVQDRIDGMATELSKALKKDLQESGMLCQAQFSELCNQLASRKAEITAKTEAYQKVRCICIPQVYIPTMPGIALSTDAE